MHEVAAPPESVATHQQAQLGFYQERAGEVYQSERMWVRVDLIERDGTREVQ